MQKGALWPSVMVTFGPCWHKVKLNQPILVASQHYWMLAARKYISILLTTLAQL